MGKLFGGGGSQTSTSETNPWGPAKEHLENILQNAGNLFDSQGGINAEWIDKELADLDPAMKDAITNMLNNPGMKDVITGMANDIQTGVSGIGQATGVLGQLAQGGGAITSEKLAEEAKKLYNSELVGQQKQQLEQDVQANLDKNVQQLNQQSSGSGNMGSSRAGVAQGVMTGEASKAIATGTAAIEQSAFDKSMNLAAQNLISNQQNQLGAAGQLGSLGTNAGQLGLGSANAWNQMGQNQLTGAGILQQHNQNILNNKWFNQQGQQNMGWDQLNKYLGVAGTIGGMGGTSTSTGPGADRFGQMLGAGSSIVGGLGMGGFFNSDERLKDKIEVVKAAHEITLEDGNTLIIPSLCVWEWNDKAHALFKEKGFSEVPHPVGVIAQELETLGYQDYVKMEETKVEGLEGVVRLVDYPSLIAVMREVGVIKEEGEA